MRILMIGDVVGRPGRTAVRALVPKLRSVHHADIVLANAENAAGGTGITPDLARELLDEAGIDVLTLGNHAWAKREVYDFLDSDPRVLRPANYPPGVPGRGYAVYHAAGVPVAVVVLQGRVFMEPVDDPFRAIDAILEDVRPAVPTIVMDFHAEATSEKQAIAWYVDGRVSAVIGTHTHVQTADERILPAGTAYLTDVGMTGPVNSVIGMKREVVLPRFTTLLPSRFEVAGGPARLDAALIDVDETSGKARSIVRIQESTKEDGSG